MPVKKEASGRRSVQVEVEVPGTPEQVWQAIATGPGISSWFVPSEVEGREGGAVVSHFGPGMDAVATVTAWDPPRRFAAEGKDPGSNAPPVATEWIVEARSGGTCVVRVVHSLFASSDDWDTQLTGPESGWPGFFRILRLYLTHFRGQRGSLLQLLGSASGPADEAWETLTRSLGLAGVTQGQRWSAPAGVPPFAGRLEGGGDEKHLHDLVLLLDEPTPGIATLSAHSFGGTTQVLLFFYLYGDGAPSVIARDEPLWRAWMSARFPAATPAC